MTMQQLRRFWPPWIDEVRSGLVKALPVLRPLCSHPNEDIADFAQLIVDELTNAAQNPPWERSPVPDFHTAVFDFMAFLDKVGYPARLLWTRPADVVLRKWRGTWKHIVQKDDHAERELDAKSDYSRTATQNDSLTLEAYGKTDDWTICRIVPGDDGQPRGIQHKAATDPPPVVLVENLRWWRVLKLLLPQ